MMRGGRRERQRQEEMRKRGVWERQVLLWRGWWGAELTLAPSFGTTGL